MKYVASLAVFVFIGVSVAANHDHHGHAQDQMPLDYVKFPYEQPLYRTSTGEGSCSLRSSNAFIPDNLPILVTADAIFSGITTFAKLPWLQCLTHQQDVPVDIAFLGAPFVSPASYRKEIMTDAVFTT